VLVNKSYESFYNDNGISDVVHAMHIQCNNTMANTSCFPSTCVQTLNIRRFCVLSRKNKKKKHYNDKKLNKLKAELIADRGG